jgi:hypothetical protein
MFFDGLSFPISYPKTRFAVCFLTKGPGFDSDGKRFESGLEGERASLPFR